MNLTRLSCSGAILALTLAGCSTPDVVSKAERVRVGSDCQKTVDELGTPTTTSTSTILGLSVKSQYEWLTLTQKVTLDCIASRVWEIKITPHIGDSRKETKS
jgi:hypothetical protein